MAEIAGGRGTRRIPWRTIGWGGAVALLLLPFVAMQFSREMNWGLEDLILLGVVIGTAGLLIELAVRVSNDWWYRAGFGLALLGMLLVTGANVAVGIVGSDDNPNNALFFWALGVGVVGAAIARLRAKGMALAMLATAVGLWVALAVAQGGPTDEPGVPALREVAGTSLFALMFVASAALFQRSARRI